jgi:hypothetical protein
MLYDKGTSYITVRFKTQLVELEMLFIIYDTSVNHGRVPSLPVCDA